MPTETCDTGNGTYFPAEDEETKETTHESIAEWLDYLEREGVLCFHCFLAWRAEKRADGALVITEKKCGKCGAVRPVTDGQMFVGGDEE